MITLNALRKRAKAHGWCYYYYIGRGSDWRYPDGSGHTLAYVVDCYRNEMLNVDATDEQIERICGKCDTNFYRWYFA